MREREAVRKDIGKSKKCDLKRGKKIISPCIRDGGESWQQESVPPCQARGQFMVCFSSRASQFVGQIFELFSLLHRLLYRKGKLNPEFDFKVTVFFQFCCLFKI